MIISLLSKKNYTVYLFTLYIFLSSSILLLLFINRSQAQSTNGTITVNYKTCTAATLLKEIDRQSAYTFVYDPLQMEGLKLQNISYKNAAVKAVLADLEARTNLSFSTLNSNISVRIVNKAPVKKQEPGKLSGRVLDEKGETFPSASIRIVELGTGVQSSLDGTYTIALPPGTYTMEVSYVSYQTQKITGIKIAAGLVTKLDISMKSAPNALKEVVVTSGYQRASVAGLYARQKTSATVTDGISAEQIARTPDNNVGAVLKRVSGLSVVDNRYVVVRGMSDRYNQAQIDGVTQPSTEMNQRNFAFDAIPNEMVSSVVVNKTASPDLSSEFAGGQVSVNTLDIPVQNFMQFQIGTGYNSNAIGKDFLQAGKRGSGEAFGIADGNHNLPPGLRSMQLPGQQVALPAYFTEQSKTFDPDGFRLYRYGFQPNQNYRFSFGRAYTLKHDVRFGFVAGTSLRNTYETTNYISTRAFTDQASASYIDSAYARQNGTLYKFNSTISGLLNIGLQGKNFKLGFRNMYSHVYKNNYNTYEVNDPDVPSSTVLRRKYNLQDPESTTLLQNKLEGEHTLGASAIKMTWNGSYTNVDQGINDRRRFIAQRSGSADGTDYYQRYYVGSAYVAGTDPDYREYLSTKEKDFNWGLNLSRPFDFLGDKSLAKIGYSGFSKKRKLYNYNMEIYNNTMLPLYAAPYEFSMAPDKVGTNPGQAFYAVNYESGNQFEGTSKSNSAYAMLDQSFFDKLRIVYGMRYEVYNLSNKQLKVLNLDVNTDDNKDFLPSANLTYKINSTMNFRASYAKTVIRPDFRETAIVGLYDPILNIFITGGNIKSTKVDNADLRYEWFLTPGEIISFSGFYKNFYKPIELVFLQDQTIDRYSFQNQKSATNYGLEMELRKSLSFIADKEWLRYISLFGNGTVVKSQVKALIYSGKDGTTITESTEKRALYGQSPWIVNAGIAYTRDQYGVNVVYNTSGRRTNTINSSPNLIEYEMGRNLIDLQMFTRLFHQKAELKLNVSNLLNSKLSFYRNQNGYTGTVNSWVKVDGTSDQYKKSEGDYITYQAKTGSNISMAFTYKF